MEVWRDRRAAGPPAAFGRLEGYDERVDDDRYSQADVVIDASVMPFLGHARRESSACISRPPCLPNSMFALVYLAFETANRAIASAAAPAPSSFATLDAVALARSA